MIEFSCSCGKTYVVKDELAGKSGKCKQCGAAMKVPAKAGERGGALGGGPVGPMPWDTGPEKKLSRLEANCGKSQVYLLLASRRFFTGEGSVDFRENALGVRGLLGQDPFETSAMWLAGVIIGNFVIALIPLRIIMTMGLPVFNIACVVYLMFRLLSGKEMKTIFVRTDKLTSITCDGPIVSLKFKAPRAQGVNAIRMFISPNFREKFFRRFDKLFPEALPEDYRAAVEKLRAEKPEEEEEE